MPRRESKLACVHACALSHKWPARTCGCQVLHRVLAKRVQPLRLWRIQRVPQAQAARAASTPGIHVTIRGEHHSMRWAGRHLHINSCFRLYASSAAQPDCKGTSQSRDGQRVPQPQAT